MDSLFVLNETFINGYRTGILDFISLVSILSGILVIVSKNPIVSVLFLIGLFLSISCYLIVLGLNFIGLSYLLVYIGAVSILFLFILMLIDIRLSELQTNTNNSILLSILIGVLYYNIFTKNLNIYNLMSSNYITNYNHIEYSIHNIWDGSLITNYDIISIGNILYTNLSI